MFLARAARRSLRVAPALTPSANTNLLSSRKHISFTMSQRIEFFKRNEISANYQEIFDIWKLILHSLVADPGLPRLGMGGGGVAIPTCIFKGAFTVNESERKSKHF